MLKKQLKLLGIQGSQSLRDITIATRGLSEEQLIATLTTTNLTDEEIAAILIKRGYTNATANEVAQTISEARAQEEAASATMANANAKASAMGATEGLSAKTRGLGVALKGLFSLISAHPIITGLALATVSIASITNQIKKSQEELYQSSVEQAEKSKENADTKEKESKTLSDLISKYKELAVQDKTNSSTRTQLKDIQDEIVDILGEQANNLDLVNGKLDKELEKIKAIKNEYVNPQNISDFEKAYLDAVNEANNLRIRDGSWTEDGLGGNNKITFKVKDGYTTAEEVSKIINELWKNQGYGSASTIHKDYDFLGIFYDEYNELILNESLNAQEKVKAIEEAIEVIKSNKKLDYSELDFFKQLVDIKERLSGSNGTITKQIDAAKSLLNQLTISEVDSNGENINSLDDYIEYRNQIIKDIENNNTIQKAIADGVLSKEDLEKNVDNYLGTLDDFSDYYNEWYSKFGSETAKNIEELKKAYFKGFPNTDKGQFESWIDSLSDSDKDLVYTLWVDYSSDNVKSTLEALSDGGNVDLTLRPKVDTSKLKESGWDVEDGDIATVFSSTFSNASGDVAVNFTPIIVDEKGNYQGVLSPDELQKYAEEVINGTRKDDLKLQIGAKFEGDKAIEDASKEAQKIHLLQDFFYVQGDNRKFNTGQWKDALASYKEYLESVGEINNVFDTLLTTKGKKNAPEFIDRVDDYIEKINNLKTALTKFKDGDFSNEDFIKLTETFPELADRSGDLDVAIQEVIDTLTGDMEIDFDDQFSKMVSEDDISKLKAFKKQVLSVTEETIKLSEKISKVKNELSGLKGAYDTISGIIEDYNTNGYYSLENLQSLLTLEPEYINALIDENGQINTNSESFKNYISEKAKSLVLNQVELLYQDILAMKVEEAQAYENAEAYDVKTGSLEDLIAATTKYHYQLAMTKDAESGTSAYTDAMKRSLDTVSNYASLYDGWLKSLNSSNNEFSNSTEKATSALEKQKEALEKNKEALEEEKEALEDYKNELETAQDSLQSLTDVTVDYIKQTKEDEIDALNKQIETLDKQKDALEEEKDQYSEIIDKKKEALQLAKEEREAMEELADKQNSVAKNRLALEVAGLDNSSAGKKSQKEIKDNLNSSEKELSDLIYEQSYDKQVKALDEQQKKFEEQIDKQIEQIDEQTDFIESKIDEINKYLDDSRRMYEDACKLIDKDNGTLYNKLWQYTYKYTTKTRAEFDNMWSNAQKALGKYRNDNISLLGVMENLQTKIYETDNKISNLNVQIKNTETRIGTLDKAINNTSKGINNTSTAINNVAGSLGTLGGSLDTYMSKLKKAIEDTEKLNKPIKGFTISYGGKTYSTNKTTDMEAAKDLARQITTNPPKDYKFTQELPWASILNRITPKYAKGTRYSKGGLSITQEDGLEAIFGKLSQGQYTLMSEGSQVFNSQMTDNLFDFSADPEGFLAKIGSMGNYGSYLSSKNNLNEIMREAIHNSTALNRGDITINSAPIYIQGDATQSTVRALEAKKQEIEDSTIKKIMHYALANRKSLW